MKIDKNKIYFTRDGRMVNGENVWELNKDGFVVASIRMTIIDFSKYNNYEYIFT